MAEKRPSFQWYPKDFLTDENVEVMSLEEQGAYRRLMDYEWLHEGLPNDIEVLAKLCRITPAQFKKLWENIGICFDENRAGTRLTHPRLKSERAKQDEWREKSRVGGKRSAKLRADKSKGGSTNVQPTSNHPHARARGSSSSSSSSLQKKAPSEPKKKARAIALPGEWKPNEKHLEIALAEGRDLDRSVEIFRDHALANGRTQLDWDRAFNNWLRNRYDDGSRTNSRVRSERESPAEVANEILAAIKSQRRLPT